MHTMLSSKIPNHLSHNGRLIATSCNTNQTNQRRFHWAIPGKILADTKNQSNQGLYLYVCIKSLRGGRYVQHNQLVKLISFTRAWTVISNCCAIKITHVILWQMSYRHRMHLTARRFGTVIIIVYFVILKFVCCVLLCYCVIIVTSYFLLSFQPLKNIQSFLCLCSKQQ